MIGIDLAKYSFELNGQAADGSVVFRKTVTRGKVMDFLAPPVGIGLYIASSVGGTTPGAVLKALWPFLLAVAVMLVILSYFPTISLLLI